MSLSELRLSLQGLLRRYSERVAKPAAEANAKSASTKRPHRHGGRNNRDHHYYYGAGMNQRQTTGLDIAKFGLLSIATLPFSLWVATFSYDYMYRVSLCQDALAAEDDEISYIRSLRQGQHKTLIGREQQLSEVKDLISKEPHQIVVVAGTNESGKSRFVAEVLRDVPLSHGVTYIQLAQIVDSLSTLTHALVNSFGLKWLQMRHSLVDVLPFAGSEILVMKERFSDRDLAQALLVITEALKAKAASEKDDPSRRPVIVIDGLGEGSTWIRSSPEGRAGLERLIKWCIFITKERRLAHVVLTGNEELVISLTDQNRNTRGHVKVVGLADLTVSEAGQIVLQELPSASEQEVKKITDVFGGFIHDVQAVSREINSLVLYQPSEGSREKIVEDVISARFLLQLERVTAAFAKGVSSEDEGDDSSGGADDEPEEMDPYLDPLKAIYSEGRARQVELEQSAEESAASCWSQLQLWQTLQKLVESEEGMTVPFADLRDEVFDGNTTPLIELMNEDVLGFEVASSSSASGWSWEVKPATPALGRAFQHLVNNSRLKERFQVIEAAKENRDKLEDIEGERRRLRKERRRLEMRKMSLQNTIELGGKLGVESDEEVEKKLESIYYSMVGEELAHEERGQELREEMDSIIRLARSAEAHANDDNLIPEEVVPTEKQSTPRRHSSIQEHLKQAMLQSYVQESSKDKFARFRESFDHIANNGDEGITAADLVRLIKATSGEDVDLEAAESFIRTWDADEDARLDYNEFVRMLLTDPKVKAKRSAAEG